MDSTVGTTARSAEQGPGTGRAVGLLVAGVAVGLAVGVLRVRLGWTAGQGGLVAPFVTGYTSGALVLLGLTALVGAGAAVVFVHQVAGCDLRRRRGAAFVATYAALVVLAVWNGLTSETLVAGGALPVDLAGPVVVMVAGAVTTAMVPVRRRAGARLLVAGTAALLPFVAVHAALVAVPAYDAVGSALHAAAQASVAGVAGAVAVRVVAARRRPAVAGEPGRARGGAQA